MAYKQKKSALLMVLKALIPYSRENIMLSFSPHRFFNELERQSNYNQKTLEHAFWVAKRKNLIKQSSKSVKLTRLGEQKIHPFIAKKLKGAHLMVIFDIPEERASSRRRLRTLLKEWNFKKVQKSVWLTDYDHKDSLKSVIAELDLIDFVEVYESVRLLPKK